MFHRKKGATLAEICIVLAVVSIISLMVVSFVSMASGRSAVSAAKLNVMEELDLVETLVDNWVAAMMQDGGKVELNGVLQDNNIEFNSEKTIIQGEVDGSVRIENLSELKIRFPGKEDEMVYPLKTVKGLRFWLISTASEGDEGGAIQPEENLEADILYFCEVEYAYSANGKEITQHYTFCINPRVGEVITLPEA